MQADIPAISILIGSFALLLILKVPITFSLIVSSIATGWYLKTPLMVVVQRMSGGIQNFSLLAIPFFILAGGIMAYGGITNRIIEFSNIIVGRVRGGLAQVNVLASMFFGGISGSAVADVSSIGVMLIPMMEKKGYDTDYSVAVTVSSACQGIIIPPSHNMIIYAFAVGGAVSVGRLFLGGFIPGILLGIFLMIISYIIAVKKGYPKEKRYSLKEALQITKDAVIGLFTFVIIIGGVIFGVFTATESAAIAVVYALLVTIFIYRTMTFRLLFKILYEGLKTLAIVMSLIAAASAFGYFLAYLKVPALATQALLTLSDNRVILLLLINLLLILLGCIMDMAPLILICAPILYPVVVTTLGMSPIQFGIMLLLNLGIGLCTPPVGSALFVGSAVGRIPIEKAAKALIPFYIMMLCVLLLITFVPFFSTFIPDLLMPEVGMR
jgi:tripartite ATP-independent transporter DctM subunit